MLDQYRKKIDQIDAKIIKLISQRYKITKKIGDFKKAKNINTVDPKREKQILTNVEKIADYLGLPTKKVISVFKNIFKISYHSQK
ncbi:chorismate mutase [Patescibacteria group bacterium]|nr:chorismate mutase [Patescibacteria group bacterium]